jgi:hypothetical protein
MKREVQGLRQQQGEKKQRGRSFLPPNLIWALFF